MKLSPRLQWIFEHLQVGQPVWDVCCDHGYLGAAALYSGKFPQVYFVDQVPEIIQRLQERFEHYLSFDLQAQKISQIQADDLRQRAHFISSDARHISNQFSGNVVIAGVGAECIISILESFLLATEIVDSTRFVLGPHKDEDLLLQWLRDHGEIELLAQIEENGRQRQFYIVILNR